MKISHHTKNWENLNLKEKRSIDANTKMTEMLELTDQVSKTAILKMFRVIMNMLETWKKIESPSKESVQKKNIQRPNRNVKTEKYNKVKNTVGGSMAEWRSQRGKKICELKYRAIEIA